MHQFPLHQIPHQHVSLINIPNLEKNHISLALFDDILQSSVPTNTSPTKNFFSGNFIPFFSFFFNYHLI
jgi:hypothetical protein